MRLFTLIAALVALLAPVTVAPEAEAQDWRLRPSYGTINLSAGFRPDPYRRTLQAGGNIRIGAMAGCPGGGYVANAPDLRVNYRSGRFVLSFYVVANRDTILLVNDPSGRWYCNDDYSGLNPGMWFNNPMSGQWDVWVGTYGPSRVSGARLYISENRPFVNF
jgi:hypothetical protein